MSRILALIVLAVVVACASAQYYAASPYYGGGVYGRSAYAAPLAYNAGYGAVGSPYAYSALNRGVYYG